jgi:SMC interacting uncharacterized protein involved in chromosome segregation
MDRDELEKRILELIQFRDKVPILVLRQNSIKDIETIRNIRMANKQISAEIYSNTRFIKELHENTIQTVESDPEYKAECINMKSKKNSLTNEINKIKEQITEKEVQINKNEAFITEKEVLESKKGPGIIALLFIGRKSKNKEIPFKIENLKSDLEYSKSQLEELRSQLEKVNYELKKDCYDPDIYFSKIVNEYENKNIYNEYNMSINQLYLLHEEVNLKIEENMLTIGSLLPSNWLT